MSGGRRPIVKLAASLGTIAILGWGYSTLPQGDASRRQVWGLGQSNYQEFREKLGARQLAEVDIALVFGRGDMVPPAVVASVPGGSFDGPRTVTLEGSARIYYTLDGSIPTRRSLVYREPLRIDSTTVVRARVLPQRSLPGPVSTWHFLIGSRGTFPVVSLVSDPVGLWNKYSGIYENPEGRGRSWEREVQVGYVEPNAQSILSFPGEVRIHGGYSRRVPKKSLRVRFRVDSVPDLAPDHILRSDPLEGENTIVLRGGGSNPTTPIRDALASSLYADLGGTVARGETVEVLLNGAYWGLYELRERIDEGFLQTRFGPGEYELLTHDSENAGRWVSPVVGTLDGWSATLARLDSLDLSRKKDLEQAAQLFDLDATIDYWLHNIYVANVDWPYNNLHVYRRLDGTDTRWKWLAWDLDPALGTASHNTLAWAVRDRVRNDLRWNYQRGAFEDQEHQVVSTKVLRTLLRADEFRDRFIARAQVLMELHYTEDRILAGLDSALTARAAAHRRDAERWSWTDSTFNAEVERVRTFAMERPTAVRHHLAEQFDLGPNEDVRVDVHGPGRVLIERYPVEAPGVLLQVARGTRLRVIAEPDEGAVLASEVPSDTTVAVGAPILLEYRFLPCAGSCPDSNSHPSDEE